MAAGHCGLGRCAFVCVRGSCGKPVGRRYPKVAVPKALGITSAPRARTAPACDVGMSCLSNFGFTHRSHSITSFWSARRHCVTFDVTSTSLDPWVLSRTWTRKLRKTEEMLARVG